MHTASQPHLTCPFSRRTNRSGSMMLSREPSGAGPRLRALPRSKPLRFGAQAALRGTDSAGTALCALPRSGPSRSGSALRQPSEAQIRLGLRFVPFPGPSSSGVWRARSPRLVTFSAAAAQLSGWTAGTPREADCDCPAPPEVLAKEPACS